MKRRNGARAREISRKRKKEADRRWNLLHHRASLTLDPKLVSRYFCIIPINWLCVQFEDRHYVSEQKIAKGSLLKTYLCNSNTRLRSTKSIFLAKLPTSAYDVHRI